MSSTVDQSTSCCQSCCRRYLSSVLLISPRSLVSSANMNTRFTKPDSRVLMNISIGSGPALNPVAHHLSPITMCSRPSSRLHTHAVFCRLAIPESTRRLYHQSHVSQAFPLTCMRKLVKRFGNIKVHASCRAAVGMGIPMGIPMGMDVGWVWGL